jgi:hypothetical protein
MSDDFSNHKKGLSYEIMKAKKMISYLKKNGRKDPYFDFDFQLQTNYGFVFILKNGRVAFIPNNFRDDAILFNNRQSYQKTINSDFFPIENPDKSLYDVEIKRISTINKQIEFYQTHLNTVLKFDFKKLDIESAQVYMKKIIGRKIKKMTTDTDLIALIAILGEILRQRINGKWLLEKWYGTYNPYYMPRILTPSKKIIHINDYILTSVKWNVADAEQLLNRSEGILSLSKTKKHHHCVILK